jgi:hypothetical protein
MITMYLMRWYQRLPLIELILVTVKRLIIRCWIGSSILTWWYLRLSFTANAKSASAIGIPIAWCQVNS